MRCTEGARKHLSLTPLIWRNKSHVLLGGEPAADTSLFLDDPLADFVHAAHLVTEVVHVLLHHSELLRPASEASD